VSTSSQPRSSGGGSSRTIIVAAVVVVVLVLIGYCAKRVASLAHVVGGAVTAAAGMQARMDTTHHVAAGSAVYLGDTKVGDIVKVVVIRADTTPPAASSGAIDSTVQAALRQRTVLYTASQPEGADVASKVGDIMLVGQVDGTYDTDTPVKITLSKRTAVNTAIPPAQLIVPGRRQPISVY
jgi:hypothetical protein